MRRSRFEVVADMLRLEESNISGYMYEAGTSSRRARTLLPFLVTKGLLVRCPSHGKSIAYKTTAFGWVFIQRVDELSSLLPVEISE